MRRLLLSVVLATAAIGVADGAATPSPSPNAAVMARAKDWFHRIATGKIDRTQLTAQMNAALTDAMIKQVSAQVAPLGDPVRFDQIQSGRKDGLDYYLYAVTFGTGDTWDYLFVYEPATDKISGLRITPAP